MVTILVYLALLVLLTPPLGAYMHRVYSRESIGRAEGVVYRLIGVDPTVEQSWRRYASSCLWFSLFSMLVLYLIFRIQGSLPLNPLHLGAVDRYLAFNTASSFTTNTNWQAYGGETTMSYLSQMLALTFQNFVSAAVGMAVLVALFRGFVRSKRDEIGNFWRDLVRGTVYILLPLAAIVAILLVTQGVVQTLGSSVSATGVQGFEQTLARGPVAGQIAIKQLGTNGGGFFNVNSAHPFEGGAGGFGNFIGMFSILLIPAALTYTFGKWIGNVRQGWAIFAVMMVLFVAGIALTVPQERVPSDAMADAGVVAGPNMEGKEVRIGPEESSLWNVATTAASNGSVDSMHDSYRPLGALAAMFNMGIGEVVWGGVGSGLYGMIFYAVIAVFIGGLMVGRTPEYLNKKIGAREVKLSAIAVLFPFILVLGLAAVAAVIPAGTDARLNQGAHGFSEIFYAFLSMGNNNGSAFAGLTASGPFYAIAGGLLMLASRFVPLLAALALAGSLGRAGTVPESPGTLHTDTTLFVVLLTFVIVVIGALTFLPGMAVGPIVEQLQGGVR